MDTDHQTLREQITHNLCRALQPLPHVLAGWEGGSIAFELADDYSDMDLNFLLDDTATDEAFYTIVKSALEAISPIITCHPEPPGRYFKLRDGGDFLLVDVCIFRTEELSEQLNVERHGNIRPLFDKGQWLKNEPPAESSQAARRAKRLNTHKAWFSVSQNFVRKAIIRGQEIEALAAFWGYTLRPLVELLRMRYCPPRWDFGMRYLHRDLPDHVYKELQSLLFVKDFDNLAEHLPKAKAWAESLIQELTQAKKSQPDPTR